MDGRRAWPAVTGLGLDHAVASIMGIIMKVLLGYFFAATFALAAMLPALTRAANPGPAGDFSIYLDPPTGFVFVKLPGGWKFVGKVDPDVVAHPPANVLTSLLDATPSSEDDERPVVHDGLSRAP